MKSVTCRFRCVYFPLCANGALQSLLISCTSKNALSVPVKEKWDHVRKADRHNDKPSATFSQMSYNRASLSLSASLGKAQLRQVETCLLITCC